MIKSDLLKSKLSSWGCAFNIGDNDADIKHFVRSGVRALRKSVVERVNTKRIYFSKLVLSDLHGLNFLNISSAKKFDVFSAFIKVIKLQKPNKSVNFIFWSNYFSYLLSQMPYFLVLAIENVEFLQRAFRKFRLTGNSYLYLSKNVSKGLLPFLDFFKGLALGSGTILFYSSSFSKFIEIVNFVYSESFLSNFILLRLKLQNTFLSEINSFFFFQSVGLNRQVVMRLLKTHYNSLIQQLKQVFDNMLVYKNHMMLINFLPLNFLLYKYGYIYASWKRLPQKTAS
jgi:hypothetical protein